jgi:hypothetical protein
MTDEYDATPRFRKISALNQDLPEIRCEALRTNKGSMAMMYSERFSDQERKQLYAELVMSSMAHYPSGESAVLAELLRSNQIEAPKPTVNLPRFSWRSLFRLPLVGAPSLT